MKAKDRYQEWERTQSHWNDDLFLAETANAFMKRRWRRLNRRVAAFCGVEARRLARGLDLVDVGCAHADFEAWARPALASYTGVEPSAALLPKDRRQAAVVRADLGAPSRARRNRSTASAPRPVCWHSTPSPCSASEFCGSPTSTCR